MCLVPDNDLFDAINMRRRLRRDREHRVFTENGIRLTSGEELEADIVVTATGLVLELLGGMRVGVDGKDVDFSRRFPTRE